MVLALLSAQLKVFILPPGPRPCRYLWFLGAWCTCFISDTLREILVSPSPHWRVQTCTVAPMRVHAPPVLPWLFHPSRPCWVLSFSQLLSSPGVSFALSPIYMGLAQSADGERKALFPSQKPITVFNSYSLH